MIALLDDPRAAVAAALAASAHPELHQLVVYESEFTVEIVGRVGSFYLKQIAQESCRGAIAGRRLINRIIVKPEEHSLDRIDENAEFLGRG